MPKPRKIAALFVVLGLLITPAVLLSGSLAGSVPRLIGKNPGATPNLVIDEIPEDPPPGGDPPPPPPPPPPSVYATMTVQDPTPVSDPTVLRITISNDANGNVVALDVRDNTGRVYSSLDEPTLRALENFDFDIPAGLWDDHVIQIPDSPTEPSGATSTTLLGRMDGGQPRIARLAGTTNGVADTLFFDGQEAVIIRGTLERN